MSALDRRAQDFTDYCDGNFNKLLPTYVVSASLAEKKINRAEQDIAVEITALAGEQGM